jgi:hypothetical protein
MNDKINEKVIKDTKFYHQKFMKVQNISFIKKFTSKKLKI